MVGFGKPAANRAAGTYVKLLVKTAKYIRPFSKYDGITGKNEEEYLVNFNSAFKVMWAVGLQSILDDMTPGDNSLRLTRFWFQVKAVLSHEDAVMFEDFAENWLPPNHDLIVLEELWEVNTHGCICKAL
jgi:hypothetical protein